MTGRHPGTVQLARWFAHDHLPQHLAEISSPFCVLADRMVEALPDGPELSAGLRKLLEAKDCMVRAAIAARDDDNATAR